MLMKSSWEMIGSAGIRLLCLGATNAVCLPRVAQESR